MFELGNAEMQVILELRNLAILQLGNTQMQAMFELGNVYYF